MTNSELEALLDDLESDRVERKASASDPGKIRHAICSFANDLPDHGLPGVLFIGANDDGSCTGLEVSDKLIQTVSSMRSDGNIVPFPSMTVQKRRLKGCEMLVVEVMPALAPPVRYSGRTCIRTGSRRDLATPEDEARLAERRGRHNLPVELRPVPFASVSDLDLEAFQKTYLPGAVDADVLQQNRRPLAQQLAGLRMIDNVESQVPTVLGALTLGRDPRSLVAAAYVQFVRFDGSYLSDPIKDEMDVSAPLAALFERLDGKLRVHVTTALDITSQSREVASPDYPIAALQQLTRNAVLHRTYEGTNAPIRVSWFTDRIEIRSPGGPFGLVTKRNFGQPGLADYRNPHLAEAMKNLGLVQKFGVGLELARHELEKNSNPPLELVAEDTFVLATVRRRR